MHQRNICPSCSRTGCLQRWGKDHLRKVRYRCKLCGKTCNQRTGTLRYRTHLSDSEWKDVSRLVSLRSSPSGSDLGRFLQRHPRTGQRYLRKIRCVYPDSTAGPPLTGTSELDETTMAHQWIVGAKDRLNKRVKLDIVPVRDIPHLNRFANTMLAPRTVALTDEWGGYMDLYLTRAHYTVCHAREFVSPRAKFIHTNGIEGVWGYAKPKAWHTYRGYPKLDEYLKEICFYFNFSYVQRQQFLFSLLFRPKTNTICS